MDDITNNMEFVRMFERRLSEYTGFTEAVCVDCCTNGILVTLELYRREGRISKDQVLDIPAQTYMSVPMTLVNNGWKIQLIDSAWHGRYQIGQTLVYDAATDFDRGMASRYPADAVACVSFQQKKRLPLGRGGAILLNNVSDATMLRRMVYDGRNPFISDRIEVEDYSTDVVMGYHCYMDPEKAALGIARLNQLTTPYAAGQFRDYPDLRKLGVWQNEQR